MSRQFEKKAVLVTGAARGMGRSHALGFAREGASVAILDIAHAIEGISYSLGSQDELERTAQECSDISGEKAIAVYADVRDAIQVEAAIQKTVQSLGHIDVLVNNAGITSGFCLADELSEADWDRVVDINLKGTWLCCKYVIPHLRRRGGGKIVNIASVAGLMASPGYPNYVAAKFGVVGLTKALAIELAEHNINVNCVCPGTVDTPMTAADIVSYGMQVEKTREIIGKVHPLGRILEPEDVTHAVLWLASEAASNVTGVALPVDAGYLIKPPL